MQFYHPSNCMYYMYNIIWVAGMFLRDTAALVRKGQLKDTGWVHEQFDTPFRFTHSGRSDSMDSHKKRFTLFQESIFYVYSTYLEYIFQEFSERDYFQLCGIGNTYNLFLGGWELLPLWVERNDIQPGVRIYTAHTLLTWLYISLRTYI